MRYHKVDFFVIVILPNTSLEALESHSNASCQLFQRIDSWTSRLPDQPLHTFLDELGQEVEMHTYRSFSQRYSSIAAYLSQQTWLSRGDRVVLVYPPGLELICSLFACVRAGLIPVPTSLPMGNSRKASLSRLDGIIGNCNPSLLLTNSKGSQFHSELISEASVNGHNETERLGRVRLLNTDEISTDPSEEYIQILDDVRPSNTFLIQYTSGSTSQPKGVIVSASNILANADIVVDHENPVCVSWLPQHHDMGLLGYYVYIVLHGGTTYGFSPGSFIQRPLLWLETIHKYQATATSVPNFALEMCLSNTRISDEALSKLNLSSLRFLMAAAEPINSKSFNLFISRFKACSLQPNAAFVAYGLAEFTLAITNYGRKVLHLDLDSMSHGKVIETSDDKKAISVMSCGVPLPGNKILIVNPDTLTICSDYSIGEVWVDGESKASSYWGLQDNLDHVFNATTSGHEDENGYLRTGDMGFVINNELYICGRLKEMIIIRGQNYYPQDIERVVYQFCPELRARAVVAFEYKENNLSKVGLIVETKIASAEAYTHKVLNIISSQIGLEIHALTFVPAKSLPRTTSGKLMRIEAKERWLSQSLGASVSVLSQREEDTNPDVLSAAEDLDTYLSILAKKYGITGDESFSIVDLGIDSIELVTLVRLIKDELEVKGAYNLSQKVDVRLIQAISIAEFFRLHDLIKHSSGNNGSIEKNILDIVESIRNKRLAAELKQMSVDSLNLDISNFKVRSPERDILLTGGNGFLGTFLLKSLLQQSPSTRRIKVLMRAESCQEGMSRLRKAFCKIQNDDTVSIESFDKRVDIVCGDLSEPNLAINESDWDKLSKSISTIYHNGAIVNYLMSYGFMRNANVLGTKQLLNFAVSAGISDFNHISTTFIFGWDRQALLLESDNNDNMQYLDFGYSQSKWASEQLVHSAGQSGMPVRIFRPALITPSVKGEGVGLDISLRLILFMIKYRITVDSLNQISFTPVDYTANNIVAISRDHSSLGGTFHVVRDQYNNMLAITDLLTSFLGIKFKPLPLQEFVRQAILTCTNIDPLYPLLDFLVHSEENINAMELKRYDSTLYQAARNKLPEGLQDPSLSDTVIGILLYLSKHSLDIKKNIIFNNQILGNSRLSSS